MDPNWELVPPWSSGSHFRKSISIPAALHVAPHLFPPLLSGGGPVSPTKAWRLMTILVRKMRCTTKCLILWSCLCQLSTHEPAIDEWLPDPLYVLGDSSVIKTRWSLYEALLLTHLPPPASNPPTSTPSPHPCVQPSQPTVLTTTPTYFYGLSAPLLRPWAYIHSFPGSRLEPPATQDPAPRHVTNETILSTV